MHVPLFAFLADICATLIDLILFVSIRTHFIFLEIFCRSSAFFVLPHARQRARECEGVRGHQVRGSARHVRGSARGCEGVRDMCEGMRGHARALTCEETCEGVREHARALILHNFACLISVCRLFIFCLLHFIYV